MDDCNNVATTVCDDLPAVHDACLDYVNSVCDLNVATCVNAGVLDSNSVNVCVNDDVHVTVIDSTPEKPVFVIDPTAAVNENVHDGVNVPVHNTSVECVNACLSYKCMNEVCLNNSFCKECLCVNENIPSVIETVTESVIEIVNDISIADVNNSSVHVCTDNKNQRQTSQTGASTSRGKQSRSYHSAWKRQTCYNCAAAGHIARNCPLPRPPSPEKDKTHVSRGKSSTPKPVKSKIGRAHV